MAYADDTPYQLNMGNYNDAMGTDLFNSSSNLLKTPSNNVMFDQQSLLNFGKTPPKLKTGFDLGGQGGSNIASALQGFGALGNAYAAFQQYQLGKKQLRQNTAAFNLNSANQAKITNAEIDDRALRRAAQRSDITGDLAAIKAAAEMEASKRRISSQPI